MNGPLYANEFLKISRLTSGNVTTLVEISSIPYSYLLQIVMQSEI